MEDGIQHDSETCLPESPSRLPHGSKLSETRSVTGVVLEMVTSCLTQFEQMRGFTKNARIHQLKGEVLFSYLWTPYIHIYIYCVNVDYIHIYIYCTVTKKGSLHVVQFLVGSMRESVLASWGGCGKHMEDT